MSLDKLIFKDKKFSDILEEIYTNQKKKSKQITAMIRELQPLIQDTGDATIIVPLIREYLDAGIKNDDHLIKMATIIQRIVNSQGSAEDSLLISEEEIEQLMQEVSKLEDKDSK
jgi:hypothetical protein|tara:strand:- start:1199 stop:1540 length:342 start_codon:yes stop_codon:yes gene_type:complete